MNTWNFQQGSESKKQDPLTFTYNMDKKELENNQQEERPKDSNNNPKEDDNINKYLKDMKFEGQRTNELIDINYKEPPKEEKEIQVEGEENINNENEGNDVPQGNYYYNNNYEDEADGKYDNYYDDYYYISEFVPPQNSTQKLKNIKLKYQKLKEEIEWLKKENQKYNPHFNLKKTKYNS